MVSVLNFESSDIDMICSNYKLSFWLTDVNLEYHPFDNLEFNFPIYYRDKKETAECIFPKSGQQIPCSIDASKRLFEKGYFIKCIFVLTKSPGLNAYRIRARVEQGGHDVPEEKIYDRYDRSLDNIKELVKICDILHIYDNTGEEPERIFRKHKEEDYKIFPNDSWNQEEILELIS